MAQPRRVLFLCVGNSVRSQMAEAIVNARYPGWQAFSAGVRPTGTVHPMALKVLRELAIHHKGRSKSADEFRDLELDLIVTVCDEAREECPVWLGKGVRKHQSFRDPTERGGTEEQMRWAFREVRDQIVKALPKLLDTGSAQTPR